MTRAECKATPALPWRTNTCVPPTFTYTWECSHAEKARTPSKSLFLCSHALLPATGASKTKPTRSRATAYHPICPCVHHPGRKTTYLLQVKHERISLVRRDVCQYKIHYGCLRACHVLRNTVSSSVLFTHQPNRRIHASSNRRQV